MTLKSLLIVDGNSIASRAFFVKKNYFFSLIDKVIVSTNGRWSTFDSMVVTFDDPYTPSWRSEIYPDYKANRTTDLEKRSFIDRLYDTAHNLGLCVIRAPEADDAIAALSVSGIAENMVIYSGDKDMFALVQSNVHLIGFERLPNEFGEKRWEKVIYDTMDVHAQFGSTPQQVMDFKALAGCKSDNIPGVRGIGDVTAKNLLAQFDSLSVIYDNLSEIPKNIRNKLIEYEADARISQRLARMDFSYPVEVNEAQARFAITPEARGMWANEVLSAYPV